ncbi:tripartite tricarboxylate transporter TctB family protein [Bacillus sp. Marseille-P3661]|uniref:tripartite tricarboxylate transporter TctB family protein n=1 Tax=Bacillus sp. Marseille-P3661 TaxID=1936234 RepID=UPI0015E17014|nr:tripartite tricarboxylate transporter TctB family protein [Bacillus sp. Marseille-P3661]
MKNEKIIWSIIVIVIACLFFSLTFSFPKNLTPTDVGPGFMPRLYAIILVLFSMILIFQGLKEKKQTEDQPESGNIKLAFLTMFLTIVFVALIPVIGFYVITPIIMIIFLKMTRVKNLLTILLVPAGTTLFIFIFFHKMLKVPVPTGIFFS